MRWYTRVSWSVVLDSGTCFTICTPPELTVLSVTLDCVSRTYYYTTSTTMSQGYSAEEHAAAVSYPILHQWHKLTLQWAAVSLPSSPNTPRTLITVLRPTRLRCPYNSSHDRSIPTDPTTSRSISRTWIRSSTSKRPYTRWNPIAWSRFTCSV